MNLTNVWDGFLDDDLKKMGIFCLECVFNKLSIQNLQNFIREKKIPIPDLPIRELLIMQILNYYSDSPAIRKRKDTYINSKSMIHLTHSPALLLYDLYHSLHTKLALFDFDFISKTEVKRIIAEFSSDFGISVYDSSLVDENPNLFDLYLTKRDPILRTGGVYILNGVCTEKEYNKLLRTIKTNKDLGSRVAVILTPLVVGLIGLRKVLLDFRDLGIWFFVIDPVLKKIYLIQKGIERNTQISADELRYIEIISDALISAPIENGHTLSPYKFDRENSYKPKNFCVFRRATTEEEKCNYSLRRFSRKFNEYFEKVIIIDESSGKAILEYSHSHDLKDKLLISNTDKIQLDDELSAIIDAYLSFNENVNFGFFGEDYNSITEKTKQSNSYHFYHDNKWFLIVYSENNEMNENYKKNNKNNDKFEQYNNNSNKIKIIAELTLKYEGMEYELIEFEERLSFLVKFIIKKYPSLYKNRNKNKNKNESFNFNKQILITEIKRILQI